MQSSKISTNTEGPAFSNDMGKNLRKRAFDNTCYTENHSHNSCLVIQGQDYSVGAKKEHVDYDFAVEVEEKRNEQNHLDSVDGYTESPYNKDPAVNKLLNGKDKTNEEVKTEKNHATYSHLGDQKKPTHNTGTENSYSHLSEHQIFESLGIPSGDNSNYSHISGHEHLSENKIQANKNGNYSHVKVTDNVYDVPLKDKTMKFLQDPDNTYSHIQD